MASATDWPVSNVSLAFPVGMPSDVALLARCDMPEDTPVEGPGLALSMVVFQLHDMATSARLADQVGGLIRRGKAQCVFGSKDLTGLWGRLQMVGAVSVRVVAHQRFYTIKDDGSADLDGPDRGYHPGVMVPSPTYSLTLNADGQLCIDGQAEPEPTDPGPTPEEQAEIDRSDAQMARERAEHDAREKAIKDEAARENAAHDAEVEREEREQAEEAKRQEAEAAKQRAAEDADMERERERAAAERKRLGIKE